MRTREDRWPGGGPWDRLVGRIAGRSALAWGTLSFAGGLGLVCLSCGPMTQAVPAAAHAGEVALVELGRRLFFDPGASHSTTVSCASCHSPDRGFADAATLSRDDFGLTQRHSQTVLNLASATPLHWDGEFATIEDLVPARTGDTRSVTGGYAPSGASPQGATLKVTPVAESLATAGLYSRAFQAAFGDPVPTRERLSQAIAAYVRTLSSTTSAFDRFLCGEAALEPEAARGYELFRGRAGCTQCHIAEGARPAFTDSNFHNTGFALRHPVRRGPGDGSEAGRQRVSSRAEDARAFKTPSLR